MKKALITTALLAVLGGAFAEACGGLVDGRQRREAALGLGGVVEADDARRRRLRLGMRTLISC